LFKKGRTAIVETAISDQEKGCFYEYLYTTLPRRTVLYFCTTYKEGLF
jgi:hypothetical protein